MPAKPCQSQQARAQQGGGNRFRHVRDFIPGLKRVDHVVHLDTRRDRVAIGADEAQAVNGTLSKAQIGECGRVHLYGCQGIHVEAGQAHLGVIGVAHQKGELSTAFPAGNRSAVADADQPKSVVDRCKAIQVTCALDVLGGTDDLIRTALHKSGLGRIGLGEQQGAEQDGNLLGAVQGGLPSAFDVGRFIQCVEFNSTA